MSPVPLVSGRHLIAMIERAGLRNGDLVTLSVRKSLGSGRYLIGLRGISYPARSTIPLEVGGTVRAAVEKSATAVLLRLQQPHLARVLDGVSPIDRAIIGHLHAIGLPLDTALVAQLRRFHRGPDDHRGLRIRIAALLADKGLEASARAVADLEALVLGLAGRRRDGERRQDRRDRRPDVPQLIREADTGDHAVQLFNHFEGRHGQWIILPVGVEEGLQGTLQLFFPSSRSKYQRSVLTLRSDDSYWAFVWDNPQLASARMLTIYTDSDEDLAGNVADLDETLSELGLSVDLRVRNEPIKASFAIFESEAIMRGVDRVV